MVSDLLVMFGSIARIGWFFDDDRYIIVKMKMITQFLSGILVFEIAFSSNFKSESGIQSRMYSFGRHPFSWGRSRSL